MKIRLSVLNILYNKISDYPPESGGILGSECDGVISHVVLDCGNSDFAHCCYAPNSIFLNCEIAKWAERRIEFQGVFHTHFAGVKTLSPADKRYIESIMKAMPSQIRQLYFPIYVLPDRELVVYRAVSSAESTDIFAEPLEIV